LEVEKALLSIESEAIEWLAERSLFDTKLLQWKVINAARKFGYLKKDTDLSRVNLKNLVLKLKDTPIHREAVREIFTEKMDVEKLKEIVSKFGKEIRISTCSKLSPIALASRQHAFDLLIPTKPTSAVLKAFRRRLEEETCILHCINCKYTIRIKVGLVDDLNCPRCKSKLVACINARRRPEEFAKEELFRIANLVMSYGKKAVYAMNTHGVGAENAARILSRYYSGEDSFFLELLEAEKRYIRTRRFWD
jgi:ATP-dependent Lhr-like helicase